ncbi:MAG: hypothetical protein AB1733_16295 [Thermodesulfobacteriota bacterium]
MHIADAGLTLGQFAITLRAESHNPTILNPDFLKNQRIVEPDWELAEDPVSVRHFAQVVYKNGIRIVAEFDTLIFSQDLWSGEQEIGTIASIAAHYVRILPHVNYQAVVNNPVADLVVPEAGLDSFVRERFIREGPWMRFREAKACVDVEFRYEIENGFFTLSVQRAVRRVSAGDSLSVILFDGTFTRQMREKPVIEQAISFIELWKSDLDTFVSFVKEVIRP